MKEIIGILGFLLLVVTAVFIDTPFIALLAIPLFLAGSILILIFYLKQIDKEEHMNILPETIIIVGIVSLCALLGYAAIEYNHFQAYMLRNQELSWNWSKILIVILINILASVLILLGIWKGSKLKYTCIRPVKCL